MNEEIETGIEVAVAPETSSLHLGQWMGRREAFGLIAGRCSAADIEIIRKMKDEKLYKSLGCDWSEFCQTHLHSAERTVDRELGYLRKYGAVFFLIRQLTRISVKDYETIAGQITDQGIDLDGKLIAAAPENGPALTAAVGELVKRSAPAPTGTTPPTATIDRIVERCQGVAEMLRAFDTHLSEEQKQNLAGAVAEIRVAALVLGAA